MRNNLDGTWTDVTRSSGLPPQVASRRAVAGDFDRDGDTDLVLARATGGLLLLDNLRGGRFSVKSAGLPAEGHGPVTRARAAVGRRLIAMGSALVVDEPVQRYRAAG